MNKILTISANDFIKQGIRTSRGSVEAGLFYYAVGIDPFNNPGYLNTGFASSQIGAGVVVDNIKWFLPTVGGGSGQTYVFGYGNTGKIYRLNTVTNVVTLLGTALSSVGNGFELYKNAVYYSTNTNLGKMTDINGAIPTLNGTFATFTNTISQHPLHSFAGSLWCGDYDHIDKNDGTTHTNNVLDLENDYTIVDIDDDGYYLVVAAIKEAAGGTASKSINKIFFWDMVSPSWNYEWEITEGTLTSISKSGGGRELVAFTGAGLYQFSISNSPSPIIQGSGNNLQSPILESDLQPIPGAVSFWRGGLVWRCSNGVMLLGKVLSHLPKIIIIPISSSTLLSFYVGGFNNIYWSAGNNLYVGSGFGNATLITGTVDLPQPYHIQKLKLLLGSVFGTNDYVQVSIFNDKATAPSSAQREFSSTNDGIVKRSFIGNVDVIANYFFVSIVFGGAVNGIQFRKLEIYGEPIDEETTI